jgi:hypothetical protein
MSFCIQSANACGLATLSIGQVVKSEFGILRAQDRQALGDVAGKHMAKFVVDSGSIWRAKPDPRFFGTVIVFDGRHCRTDGEAR